MSSWKYNNKVLLITWILFTFYIGIYKCTKINFCIISLVMFCIIQIYNKIKSVNISIRNIILQSFISNFIFWYLVYQCNNFLWIYPYDDVIIVSAFLIHFYVCIYTVIEFK